MKNPYSRFLFFLTLLVCSQFFLYGEQLAAINIYGLKRTKEETVLSLLGIGPGDEISTGQIPVIEQKLRKAEIFQEDILIELIPGERGSVLNITLHDKWTFIGLPFFSASSNDISGGALVMDSNFGGKMNNFLSYGLLSKSGDAQLFILFSDPTFLKSDVELGARVSGGKTNVVYTSMDEDFLFEDYSESFFYGGIWAGYPLTERLEVSLGLEGTYKDLERKSLIPPEESDLFQLTLEAAAEYDGTVLYPLFYKGIGASMNGAVNWEPGKLPTGKLSTGLRAGFLIGNIFHVELRGTGGITNNPFHSLFLLGGEEGSHSLPAQSIASDLFLTGELKSELRLFKLTLGYITAPVFYESGLFRDYVESLKPYHGMGGGFRFYLDKVALPAIGLEYRHNFTAHTGGLNFYLGMSF